MKYCLVRLKQKDLNAVSAAQILSNRSIAYRDAVVFLTSLDYYQLIAIDVDEQYEEAIEFVINDTYIFSNPNKQFLYHVTQDTQMTDDAVYAHVFRKRPINLSRFCTKLNASLGSACVRSVFISDLWQFTTDIPCDLSLIQSQWVISDEKNGGMFSHPLIHQVRVFRGVDFLSNLDG